VLWLLATPVRGNAVLEWIKLLASLVSLSSLLAWVALPWVYLAGKPLGDDSVTFILNTGIYPPLVSAGAALVLAGGLVMFLKRVEGLQGVWMRLCAQPAEFVTPAARRTLAVSVVVFSAVAGLALGLGVTFGTSPLSFLSAPADYTQVANISLSERALTTETVCSFTLAQPAKVSLFFAMRGLTRGPAKIVLTGPNGYENIVFTAGEKASGSFVVHPRDLPLDAGLYRVVLTFPQDAGVLVISQKIEAR
jgi:hypothetical protein